MLVTTHQPEGAHINADYQAYVDALIKAQSVTATLADMPKSEFLPDLVRRTLAANFRRVADGYHPQNDRQRPVKPSSRVSGRPNRHGEGRSQMIAYLTGTNNSPATIREIVLGIGREVAKYRTQARLLLDSNPDVFERVVRGSRFTNTSAATPGTYRLTADAYRRATAGESFLPPPSGTGGEAKVAKIVEAIRSSASAMTVTQLVAATGMSDYDVRSTVARHPGVFRVTEGGLTSRGRRPNLYSLGPESATLAVGTNGAPVVAVPAG